MVRITELLRDRVWWFGVKLYEIFASIKQVLKLVFNQYAHRAFMDYPMI